MPALEALMVLNHMSVISRRCMVRFGMTCSIIQALRTLQWIRERFRPHLWPFQVFAEEASVV